MSMQKMRQNQNHHGATSSVVDLGRRRRRNRSLSTRSSLTRDSDLSFDALDRESRRQFLRLVRDERDGAWALQSATVELRPRECDSWNGSDEEKRLKVCALVHYGTEEYYRGMAKDFKCGGGDDGEDGSGSGRCATLVELITSRENLTVDVDASSSSSSASSSSSPSVKLWRLGTELAPTAEARALAEAHGLRAQLDVLDARKDGWFVADVTREELIALREEAGQMTSKSAKKSAADARRSVVSTANLPPAIEALVVTATGRASGGDPARLFARMSCWFVPCPEAHLLLLDWVWAGGRPSNVLGAMVDCCAAGDLTSARRLAFAQMIVSAQATGPAGGGSSEPILVARRNDVAIDGVKKAFKAPGVDTVNLLYGGLHVPGLVECARERLDMDVVDVEWRDAWRVTPPSNASPLRYAILPLLLCIDGTDWAQTLHDAVALGPSAGVLAAFLYIVRHGALYYALGKWLLEWNRQLFETADDGVSPDNVNFIDRSM